MRVPSRCRLIVLAVVGAMLLVACGGADQSAGPTEDGASASTVTFAQVAWPGVTVKNEVATQILGALGYETETTELSLPAVASGLSNGDLQVWLGNWWPSQQNAFQEFIDDGSVEVVTTNLSGTVYHPAVPTYVTEDLDVSSFSDLAANAGEFDSRFLGIEAGSPGNQHIKDAIEQDAYGLGDWEVVTSSTSSMLTEVRRRIENQEPVAFLGWKPHWMTVAWDLHFLEDPEEVWPGGGEVRTVVNGEFPEGRQNVMTFLEQLTVELQTQSSWINEYGQKDRPAEEVATEWISGNLDTVASWVDGVQTVDGEPAGEALRAEFSAQAQAG